MRHSGLGQLWGRLILTGNLTLDRELIQNTPQLQVTLDGTRSTSGSWSGFVIITVTPASAVTALPFNATADVAAASVSCAAGGQFAPWRVVLRATARVAVVACGASAGAKGRSVYSATVTVEVAATVRVEFSVGGGGLTAAAFTPVLRSAFVTAVARNLGINVLRVEILQVRIRSRLHLPRTRTCIN